MKTSPEKSRFLLLIHLGGQFWGSMEQKNQQNLSKEQKSMTKIKKDQVNFGCCTGISENAFLGTFFKDFCKLSNPMVEM